MCDDGESKLKYVAGLDSKGDSSFLQYVVMNSDCKTKGVVLMEDLRFAKYTLTTVLLFNLPSCI